MAYGQMLFHPQNCLNRKKPFARACQLCIAKCPHKAINDVHAIDLERCTECGLCMGVCPSDGFVDRSLEAVHDYLFQTEEIVLNCPAAEPEGWEIPCLGILDRDFWLVLLVLAELKKVKLLTGRCVDCADKSACEVSVSVFQEIHAQWPGHPAVQLLVKPDQYGGEDRVLPKNPELDKDPGLRNWREMGRKKIESLLPGLVAEETYNIPLTRRWLVDALELVETRKIPFLALIVTEACTNCGVCTAICPQGALMKRQNGQALQLVLEPLKCVQCGRCLEICQPKALSLQLKMLSANVLNGKILLHEGQPKFCSRCGKQIFHSEEPPLCAACATQNPERHDILF